MSDPAWFAYYVNVGAFLFCMQMGGEPTWAVVLVFAFLLPISWHIATEL